MSDDAQARHDSEYQTLLALYIALLKALRTSERDNAFYSLAQRRVEIAFGYCLKGFGIDIDRALFLLRHNNISSLTQRDRDIRDRLEAALINLIDFGVCEEYQLLEETLEAVGDDDIDYNSDEYDELVALCGKYNDTYSAIENSDIEYASLIAARWIALSPTDYLMYWTQNDAKVRPWHLALQGYAAPRDEFPSWMIPPIEYHCRCFLELLEVPRGSIDLKRVKGAAQKIKKPSQIGEVYGESLAKCGKIFSSAHNYFNVKESDRDLLKSICDNLKKEYYGQD